jgi:hypothetical protein
MYIPTVTQALLDIKIYAIYGNDRGMSFDDWG